MRALERQAQQRDRALLVVVEQHARERLLRRVRCAGSATRRAISTLSSSSAIALRDVAHLVVHDPEVLRVEADGALVAELARDVRRVRVERDRHLEVAAVDGEDAEVGDDPAPRARGCRAHGRSASASLEQHAGGLEVALLGRQDAGAVERALASLRRCPRRARARRGSSSRPSLTPPRSSQ